MNASRKHTDLPPPPDRESLEREIHNLLGYGDCEKIARFTRRSAGHLQRQYNPADFECESSIFKMLEQVWGMYAARTLLGSGVARIVRRELDAFEPTGDSAKNSDEECGELLIEIGKLTKAQFSRLSVGERLLCLAEVEREIQELKIAIVKERIFIPE